MRIKLEQYRTYKSQNPDLKKSSRYLDSKLLNEGRNYRQWDPLWERLELNRTRRWFERKDFRQSRINTNKQYRHNLFAIRRERENAFKHHWHWAAVCKANYFHVIVGLTKPTVEEVDEWAAENCQGAWCCTVEHYQGLKDPYACFYTYWFEMHDDAILCRLTFQC